ncbi:MAG: 16S rRNA (guanine(966)-N(2))-methyltransferase RsmD [Deltaproteobacteria bacterium]|nr:16S rRNA (guanine(966)-N(2))-methyltransferase RsmD [Deltaproteobacteria bacterium]
MRIVAGEFRGRRLDSPRTRKIRPTPDRVREALFSMLAQELPGAKVLDLFAGTGALGLEALSRGAAFSVFVDNDPEALRLIYSNIRRCGVEVRTRVIAAPAEAALSLMADEGSVFDLIFMDPPYGKGHLETLLPQLHRIAGAATLVIAEHHTKDILPPTCGIWLRFKQRFYGDTAISIYSPLCDNPEDLKSAR